MLYAELCELGDIEQRVRGEPEELWQRQRSLSCVASSAASIVSGVASTAVASAASFAIAAARGRGGGVRPTQNDT